MFTIGLVAGIAATDAGIPPLQTIGMGVLFFSPGSTVTTIELLESGTPAVVIVITALSVVIHLTIVSLSIAPYFERLSLGWKWLLAYLLNTPNYALSTRRYEVEPTTDVRAYYLGTGLPLWLVWQTSLGVGVLFGVGVPPQWEFDFVIPLVFIALLGSMLKDRITATVACVAGVTSVAGIGLPLNSGLIVAALVGTTAGVLLQRGRWAT